MHVCAHVHACGHKNMYALMYMIIIYLCGVIRNTYYIM